MREVLFGASVDTVVPATRVVGPTLATFIHTVETVPTTRYRSHEPGCQYAHGRARTILEPDAIPTGSAAALSGALRTAWMGAMPLHRSPPHRVADVRYRPGNYRRSSQVTDRPNQSGAAGAWGIATPLIAPPRTPGRRATPPTGEKITVAASDVSSLSVTGPVRRRATANLRQHLRRLVIGLDNCVGIGDCDPLNRSDQRLRRRVLNLQTPAQPRSRLQQT